MLLPHHYLPITVLHVFCQHYIAILLHGHLFLICWLFIGWQLLTVSSPIVGYQHFGGSFSDFLHQIKLSAGSQWTVDNLSAICLWHVKKLSIMIIFIRKHLLFIWLWHLHGKENFLEGIRYTHGITQQRYWKILFLCSLASVFGPQTRPPREELQDFWTIMRHKDGYLVAPRWVKYINSCYSHKWTFLLSCCRHLEGLWSRLFLCF